MDLTYDPQSNLLLISDDTFLRTVRLHDGFVQSIPLVQYPIWGIAVHGHFLAITVPDVDQVLVLLVHCEQEYICRCKTTYSTTGLCYASGNAFLLIVYTR